MGVNVCIWCAQVRQCAHNATELTSLCVTRKRSGGHRRQLSRALDANFICRIKHFIVCAVGPPSSPPPPPWPQPQGTAAACLPHSSATPELAGTIDAASRAMHSNVMRCNARPARRRAFVRPVSNPINTIDGTSVQNTLLRTCAMPSPTSATSPDRRFA